MAALFGFWWIFFTPGSIPRYMWYSGAIVAAFSGPMFVGLATNMATSTHWRKAGWLMVIAAPQIADAIGSGGMNWLIAGGLSYTIGAAFYMAKKMVYSHAIWHVFVLVGGLCHFLAVVWYVLPVSQMVPTG